MTGRFTVAAALGLVGGIAMTGVLLMRSSLDWPPAEVQTIQGRQVVDANGHVTHLDSASVVVAPTVLGFNGRRFLLDRDTRILVGDKDGGIGDLYIGANVAVIYEPRSEGLLARWLGVNVDRQALRLAALRAETPPGDSEPAPAVRNRAGSTDSQPQPPARRGAPPAPTAEVGAASRGRALPPKPEPARPAPRPTSSGPEADDPGAVIDWLLRESGRN